MKHSLAHRIVIICLLVGVSPLLTQAIDLSPSPQPVPETGVSAAVADYRECRDVVNLAYRLSGQQYRAQLRAYLDFRAARARCWFDLTHQHLGQVYDEVRCPYYFATEPPQVTALNGHERRVARYRLLRQCRQSFYNNVSQYYDVPVNNIPEEDNVALPTPGLASASEW
jgi:hypothetical protein